MCCGRGRLDRDGGETRNRWKLFYLSQKWKWTLLCCCCWVASVVSDSVRPHRLSGVQLCDPMGLYSLWNPPGQDSGVGSLSLLPGIFPTQRSNPGLLHCRQILYQLSHQGSLRILEWVAFPFSRGSSWPRNQTGVSCIAGGFFTNWAMREA